MSNYITSNGTFTFNITGQAIPATTVINLAGVTGSNVILNVANVNVGATGTAALTSSLTSVRYAYFSNESSSSVLYIFPTVAQTTPLCILQPGDFALLPNTASVQNVQYWAYASGSQNPALWEYIICEV